MASQTEAKTKSPTDDVNTQQTTTKLKNDNNNNNKIDNKSQSTISTANKPNDNQQKKLNPNAVLVNLYIFILYICIYISCKLFIF